MTTTPLADLKARLREITNIEQALMLLAWDQETYMPPGGNAARGRQMATLGRIAQEKMIDPEMGRLLEKVESEADALPWESDDAALIRQARRNYDRLTKIPPELTSRLVAHFADSYHAWTKARPNNDFAAVMPYLEKSLDLSREVANCFPGYDHIADPLIDESDYGMSAASVSQLFAELRAELVPLVEAITAAAPADDSCLKQHFPEDEQRQFGEMIIKQFGYDFERGRQDKTHHPFAISFSVDDVRITTRFKENDLSDGLFSTLHEAGHAMYEQGIAPSLEGLPLAGGTSSGVHESQSRLWENIVGRSLGFWEHYYPQLQAAFPAQMGAVPLDTFYRAINKVSRSLIRTDADEVTYNLHVMIRFDLELALLEGKLAIRDLPEAWHARYESDLGLRAPNDIDGVLQDVHWYGGTIGGAFQGYTLGNVLSSLFYDQACQAHPAVPAEIAQGKFATLHGWMRDNIYQHGSKFTAPELIQRVTGGPMTSAPYMAYLRGKYGALYDIN
ncbi:MAG: carboxypeptidase M32 [Anaerolineales bacterium]|nr:carboxypeptidase M32 [Anaerolineales bacterium]